MVKKVAPPAGSPVRARGVKKQGSKARSPRKPRNKLLKVPARACSICRQTTHDADRDFREFVWLEWTQRHFTKDGAEHPSGNECYRCFHCRRRHFKEFKTLKNFAGKMEKDPSLRDKFGEARKDDSGDGPVVGNPDYLRELDRHLEAEHQRGLRRRSFRPDVLGRDSKRLAVRSRR